MPQVDKEERGRGFLTKRDRGYLFGEKSYGEAAERNVRSEIRDRFKNAIKDFAVVADEFEPRDLEQVFDESNESHEFVRGMQEALYVLYLGYKSSGMDFGYNLEEKVSSAEFDHNVRENETVVEPDVTFNVDVEEREPVEIVVDKLRDGEPVTGGELVTALTASEVDDYDISEVMTIELGEDAFLAYRTREEIARSIVYPLLQGWHEIPASVEFIHPKEGGNAMHEILDEVDDPSL